VFKKRCSFTKNKASYKTRQSIGAVARARPRVWDCHSLKKILSGTIREGAFTMLLSLNILRAAELALFYKKNYGQSYEKQKEKSIQPVCGRREKVRTLWIGQ
jgi:hypothetical protein